MTDLRELYQEVILDHTKNPRNFRELKDTTNTSVGHNPLCGDKITIYLKLEGDRIVDVSFEGRGCAISTASASLMTEILKGKTIAEAEALFKRFHAEVTGGEVPGVPTALVEDSERLEPLTGVKTYPARVKCATLAWHAFEAAIKSGALGATVKTE
jgi:nitrogen fixation NifU-like protein